jgi:hypothetical protein
MKKKLDDPLWDTYLVAQAKLRDRATVDDTSWSLEAQLDRLLLKGATAEDAAPAGRTAARRERYQAALRRRHIPSLDSVDGVGCADAGVVLARVRALAGDEWPMLMELGEGATFDELGAKRNASAGSMRVRVFRLRSLFMQAA